MLIDRLLTDAAMKGEGLNFYVTNVLKGSPSEQQSIQ